MRQKQSHLRPADGSQAGPRGVVGSVIRAAGTDCFSCVASKPLARAAQGAGRLMPQAAGPRYSGSAAAAPIGQRCRETASESIQSTLMARGRRQCAPAGVHFVRMPRDSQRRPWPRPSEAGSGIRPASPGGGRGRGSSPRQSSGVRRRAGPGRRTRPVQKEEALSFRQGAALTAAYELSEGRTLRASCHCRHDATPGCGGQECARQPAARQRIRAPAARGRRRTASGRVWGVARGGGAMAGARKATGGG